MSAKLNKIELSEEFMVMRKEEQSPEVFCKKDVLENSQNSQENICARESFLIKLQASRNY